MSPQQSGRHGLEDLRVTRRRLAGRWSFSRSHEQRGGASAASFLSESNFSTYCKTTHAKAAWLHVSGETERG